MQISLVNVWMVRGYTIFCDSLLSVSLSFHWSDFEFYSYLYDDLFLNSASLQSIPSAAFECSRVETPLEGLKTVININI